MTAAGPAELDLGAPILLRARIVLPVAGPPIDNGAVRMTGSRITEVGPWTSLSGSKDRVLDLGETALLPGLVNAHCHLEYTGLAGRISPPESFSSWLQAIIRLKEERTADTAAADWLEGAQMLLRDGVTTVANIDSNFALAPMWSRSPLRIVPFLEMTGVRSGRPAEEIFSETAGCLDASGSSGGLGGGLSPHALYSTLPALVEMTAAECRRRTWRMTMHVAESSEESAMFHDRRGPLFDWLAQWRDMSDCGGMSPVHQLERLGALSENFLAVHANYLAEGDAERLAENGASVVHCPRSHAYFRHRAFPLEELDRCGVNLCLGTDSLASVEGPSDGPAELSLFAEMRALAAAKPGLAPRKILELATVGGARALGLEDRVGALRPGMRADLVAVPYGGNLSEVHEALVHFEGAPACVVNNGRPCEASKPCTPG